MSTNDNVPFINALTFDISENNPTFVGNAVTAPSLILLRNKHTITAINDQDDMSNNSDTSLVNATINHNYVDAQLTASDLDFENELNNALSIDLDSETLTIANG